MPVPESITRTQALIVLHRAGLYGRAREWALNQDPETGIIWDTVGEFHRSSAMIGRAGEALGLSAAEIDALFEAAAAIDPGA